MKHAKLQLKKTSTRLAKAGSKPSKREALKAAITKMESQTNA